MKREAAELEQKEKAADRLLQEQNASKEKAIIITASKNKICFSFSGNDYLKFTLHYFHFE